MIFESLWPLFFLASIPIVIILYLLKPKGTDYLISSNLLWKKIIKNEQSRTFFEKFVQNLLMYLQILIILLLMVALMSPFLQIHGQSGERTILLMDTSGSMQHQDSSGMSRFEAAITKATNYVKSSENTKISIVSCNALQTNLLAVDSTDQAGLQKLLQTLQPDDCGGNLASAQSMLEQIVNSSEETTRLIVCTDGQGADAYENLQGFEKKELWVFGTSTNNVSNNYLSFTNKENGNYDILTSITNYSDQLVSLDVSLFEEDSSLLAVKQISLKPEENNVCLFSDIPWIGQTCSASLSGISFENGKKDSLTTDNKCYAIKNITQETSALLIGEGNTFLEKAFTAVTGEPIPKATANTNSMDYTFSIYDAGFAPSENTQNILAFNTEQNTIETLQNVVLSMEDCDLTANLSGFQIGVNKTNVYTLPEWANPFLEYNEKCVGYYGEHDGIREIVVGFDIRESDFPLRAEFPIFLANAMNYLSDSSWLTSNTCYSGESVSIQPWIDMDSESTTLSTAKAGLYKIEKDDYQEYYTVRFQTATESDGRITADSILNDENMTSLQRVKKTLRNTFLVIAFILLFIEWFCYVRQMRYKGKFYLVIRGFVLLLLTLALLDVQIYKGSNKTTTIFVVDVSDSNKSHKQEICDYLEQTIKTMPQKNNYGIVTFGMNSMVEQFLTEDPYFAGLMTTPITEATSFEDSLSRALSMISGDSNARIVILTDGKETKGDIKNLSYAVLNSNVELLTILYESEHGKDAYIENVTLPTYLHPGDLYSVTIWVESNYETEAVLSLYHGSNLSGNSKIHLNKGTNCFVMQQQVTEETMENLRVKIDAQEDTCPENDFYNAYSVVEAPPKVLVISGNSAKTSAFTSLLNSAGCDYSVVSTLNAPEEIDEMLKYKCIILVNSYIDELSSSFLNHLESYVKDYGCGFVCCGGENSFALGGYRDSVIEKILPVDMLLRPTNEMPSMAMVMVIDHSGSMTNSIDISGPSNLDIAIKSATVAVDNLREEDYVGVLTFDDNYEWQVEITQNTDRDAIKEKIKKIREGGGTTIKPSLQEAFQQISQCDASIKHVVLLTDGIGETTDYSDIINSYSNSGITLSTVAVGEDSDTILLEHLANGCGGRYYYSSVSSDIPKIFAQEVYLGSDSYIQNGDISLSVQSNHELTRNLFTKGWPNLYGYISSSPKTTSTRVIVSTEKEDPILTVWQYGLGRTIAWNSDVSGEWSGPFSGKEDYVQLWKRIIDYSSGNGNLGDDSVTVATIGDTTQINYFSEQYSNDTQILTNMISPDGTMEEIKLQAIAPGQYKAEISTSQKGLYHFNIRREDEGSITNYVTTASAVQYSNEYKFDVSTKAYEEFIEKYGKKITIDEDIWKLLTTKKQEKYPLTNILLALGLLLFIFDIAIRRFQYIPNFTWIKIHKTEITRKENSNSNGPTNTDVNTQSTTLEKQENENKKLKKQDKASKKKKKEAESVLDTSLLLKKKEDRNL